MATIDLTNDIVPVHAFRPVKPKLSELRSAIVELDTDGAYSVDLLDKMNRNDLTFTLRTLQADALPFAAPVAPEEPVE